MKHSIALGITMLFLSGIAVGQELPENLISEQLEQGFYDLDNPESLIYEKKELYFYNGYGLKERSERYTRVRKATSGLSKPRKPSIIMTSNKDWKE